MKGIHISGRSKKRLIMLVQKLLSLDPREEGSPLRERDADNYGDIECSLCGVTWHGVHTIDTNDHMKYCPVYMIDKLDRELEDQHEAGSLLRAASPATAALGNSSLH
jgi:hypothetical protein